MFGWALSPKCLFLFSLHLEWSLYRRFDKIKCKFYICKLLFWFSLWFKFSLAWLYCLWKCTKGREKKVIGESLNLYKQFFKDVICIFWCYSVWPNCRGSGTQQFLGKSAAHFPYFYLVTLLSNDQINNFTYSTYLFLLQPSSLLIKPLLINHIFSWKSKLWHTGADIACFFPKMQIFH